LIFHSPRCRTDSPVDLLNFENDSVAFGMSLLPSIEAGIMRQLISTSGFWQPSLTSDSRRHCTVLFNSVTSCYSSTKMRFGFGKPVGTLHIKAETKVYHTFFRSMAAIFIFGLGTVMNHTSSKFNSDYVPFNKIHIKNFPFRRYLGRPGPFDAIMSQKTPR
jgi:hypothetical protein